MLCNFYKSRFGDARRRAERRRNEGTTTFSTANTVTPNAAPPTFSGILGLLPLLLRLPHYSGGGDGGVGGRGGHTGGHSGRDLLGPEAPSDEFEVDRLAGVPEHLHRLLVGVTLDVYAIDLQGAIVHGGGGGRGVKR